MNISKKQIDDLNIEISIDVVKDDYHENVEKTLKDYAKSANIPGFRKGHIPMGMVRSKYGKGLKLEEVNKLIQTSLQEFLEKEKILFLGNPIPKQQDSIDLEKDDLTFAFELGLQPTINAKLKTKKANTQYQVNITDDFLDKETESIRKQYGKVVSKDVISGIKTESIVANFANEELDINNDYTIAISDIKKSSAQKSLLKKKVGDVVVIKSKDLFEHDHNVSQALNIDLEKAKDLNADISMAIKEINLKEMCDIDQEFFDKIWGKDEVKSEEEFKTKLKETYKNKYDHQSDQLLLNSITENLIKETKFDLPETFLKKWIQHSNEQEMNPEQADTEYAKSEEGLRYQLIEGTVLKENDIKVEFEDLKDYARQYVKTQMLQFGRADIEDKELEDIVMRILTNKEESNRLSSQLVSEKLLALYKEKSNISTKKISVEDFEKKILEKNK